MAKDQENILMAGDIADDWVDIGDDDQYSDDTKPKIDAQDDDDHVKAKVDQNKAPDQSNEKSSSDDEGKILNRDIQVAQNMAKVFDCKDNIIELEIVSGAKVQFTKKRCDDQQGSNNSYIVRLIGYLKSVEKAEKLIKAVVSLVEAGGIELLQFKNKKYDSAAVSAPPGFKFSQPAAATQEPRTMQPARPRNLYNITTYPFPEAFPHHIHVSPPPGFFSGSFGPFGVSSSAGQTTPVLSQPVSFNQSARGSFSRTLVTQPPPQGKSQGPFNQSGGSVSRPFAPHRSGKNAAAASKSHH